MTDLQPIFFRDASMHRSNGPPPTSVRTSLMPSSRTASIRCRPLTRAVTLPPAA